MTDEMNTTTGVALDVWDIVAVVIYFGLIMGVGLLVSQSFEAFHHLNGYAESLSGIFHQSTWKYR